jgi:hypothetical protein
VQSEKTAPLDNWIGCRLGADVLYLVNLLAALWLFYSGFVHTFWGNDPYLGWVITIIAAFVMAEPLLAIMDRTGLTGWRRRWAVIGTLLLVSWLSLGVGELPEKTEMMVDNLPMPKITGV